MKGRSTLVWLILMLFISLHAYASHIVGGEVSYKYLGNDKYRITVTIYEDCHSGYADAIANDNPAYLNIFDDSGRAVFNHVPYYDSIFIDTALIVPANFSNLCINNPPSTCLRKAVFTKDYHLPTDTTGYTVIYQRCCRNAGIINILDPSNVGATYYCYIPSKHQAVHNNSAVFKNYPPQIICIDNPLVYDHSAYDPDGDSLSYGFGPAYAAGTADNSKPAPILAFDTVNYRSPFTYLNPMNGYPKIQIDPKTGLITGTPNVLGRYVVTVFCYEWRNGVIINAVVRDFQFIVTNCSKAVVADIPQLSTDYNTYIVDCQDYTVHFLNDSKGGFDYYWDFGDTTTKADTSHEFEPTYVYHDTGTYTVKLIVNRNSTCPDSITRLVKVYPKFNTDFDYTGLQCPGSQLTFTDKTKSTFKPITLWAWNFGDGTSSEVPDPVHTYKAGGTYNVMLVSKNVRNCTDTIIKRIVIEKFKPFSGDDTVIVKGESINFQATGGTQYAWTPATYLNDPGISDPVGTYPDTGLFTYKVHVISPFGCSGYDTVNVLVVNQAAIFVPSGFTPNGDGLNDVLRPIMIGYRAVKSFDIYNRWGQLVFHSTDPADGWDGTYNGRKADVGTYYWMAHIIDRKGNEQFLKGDVTLIR